MIYQDYTTTFDDLLKKDGSVCIHHRNIQLVAIEMFKVKNNICPEIIKHLFKLNKDANSEKTFLIPNATSEFMGKLSLRWFGPVVWEIMLPKCYKNIVLLDKFKEDIKEWTPDNCPCRLCKNYIGSVGFIEVFD